MCGHLEKLLHVGGVGEQSLSVCIGKSNDFTYADVHLMGFSFCGTLTFATSSSRYAYISPPTIAKASGILTIIPLEPLAISTTLFLISSFVIKRKYKFKCVKSKEILIMHTFLCAGKKET